MAKLVGRRKLRLRTSRGRKSGLSTAAWSSNQALAASTQATKVQAD
jgi:hypothetical protein